MSEPNLSTRQLRAFVALAEARNFTRAAARCHLSQPAFSALIRSLESTLGARLFDRTTRTVELTAEGSLFLDGAMRLLHDVQATVADLGDHVARRRGRVSLAALPALAAGWLPRARARPSCWHNPSVQTAFTWYVSAHFRPILEAQHLKLRPASSGLSI